jgi:hypothetical protein
MRDRQLATFLETWNGFTSGTVSSSKPNVHVRLSEVLETCPIPQGYFLTPRACMGIIRRAGKRGKELPTMLLRALEAVAQDSTGGGFERQDPVIACPMSQEPSAAEIPPAVDSGQILNLGGASLPATVGTISDGTHYGGAERTGCLHGPNHPLRTVSQSELKKAAIRQPIPTSHAFGGNNTSGAIETATAVNASHTASGRLDFESETFIVES